MTVERSLRMIAGGFVIVSVLLGILRQPELPVVHAVRGIEPVPIGIYAMVSDDDTSSQSRGPRLKRMNRRDLLVSSTCVVAGLPAATDNPPARGRRRSRRRPR